MKKTASILLVLVLVIGLAACGGGKSDDPNVGNWNAVSATMLGIEMEVDDLFESGVTLEIKANGKFTLNVDGEKGSGKWEYAGSTIKMTASGVEMTGTIENGTLTLNNLLDMGMDITFEKEGGYTGGVAAPAATGAAGDAGYYVVDTLTDGDTTIEREQLLELGLDWYILLNEDGTAQVDFDDVMPGTWKEGTIDLGDAGVLDYAIKGDVMTLEIDGEAMTLRRSSDTPPAPASTRRKTPTGDNLNALQQWWNGDWYGFIYLPTADGAWESLEDGWWDCFATIDSDAMGKGSIFLWDDGGELGSVSLQITENGVSAAGAAMSESGHFNKMEIGHADWIIDPGTNTQPYDHLIIIDGTFEDPDGSEYGGFMYELWLRPWGMLWDDADEEDQPPGYHDWYLDRFTGLMPTMDEFLSGTALQPATGGTGSTGGNASGNPLVGTWMAEGDGAGGTVNKDYVYEFKADGTGVYTIFGDARPFTYVASGNSIDIVYYPGTKDESEDTFEFELEGDTLKITTWIDTKVYARQ
ncbi:DUF5640 domain-containing protein [Ruminococcaceae bacterium OttesenSCG-928-D13]|nr:DUF5640 domain-containing protein [Ruminococcaceae bacterium OttesenSCG-928-D13]